MEKLTQYKPDAVLEQTHKISVIVAVYRVEPYLERCVRSIQAQTYRNLEILLVDDGSDDGCPALCDRFAAEDERIRVIHKENGGLSDARNAGTAAATGSYLAYVDGDDWIEPTMYETMLAALLFFRKPICACNYKRVYRDRTEDGGSPAVWIFQGSEMLECFLAEDDAVQIQNAAWNKLYERTLLERQGEAPLRFPKGKLFEDIVYTTKLLARADGGVYLDEALYDYVLEREDSIMNQVSAEKLFRYQIPAYEEKEAFLREIGREDLAWEHRYFYYLRLLQYYRQWAFLPGHRTYRGEIRRRIRSGRYDFDRIYACPAAKRIERYRAKAFVLSPACFLVLDWMLTYVVFPAAARVRKEKQREK